VVAREALLKDRMGLTCKIPHFDMSAVHTRISSTLPALQVVRQLVAAAPGVARSFCRKQETSHTHEQLWDSTGINRRDLIMSYANESAAG